MIRVRAALSRMVGMFTKHRGDDELREELESHLEMETAEYIRRGMRPDAARRRALLASGGLTQAADATRTQRGVPWLESVAADVTYAVRALRHAPVFTAVVALTLALGIGANTAIFSVVRGVLLKPLPHRDGDRLVYLRHSMDGLGGAELTFSVPEVRDLRGGVPSLAGIAEYSPFGVVHQASEGAVRWSVGLVTGNYFQVMGLSPVVGRLTLPSDDGPGAAPVAVLTYATWINRFGGDSSVVGRQIPLDKRQVTVVGVLQPAPNFPERVEAFLNMVNSEHHMSAVMVEGRAHRMTQVVARLAPKATLARARTEVGAVYSRMQRQHPEAYDAASHYRVAVIPFREVFGERAQLTLRLLMGAAALVLIIAVANVANLTLMRGVRREHELVVRAALGAAASRLRRLLLVENLLLAFMGAACGILIAIGGLKLLTAFAARYSLRASEIALDGVVLSFTVALSVLVALVLSYVGWTPPEGRLATWIAAGARRVTGSVRKQRLQRGLVVAQVAMSVVLLAGAGLLTRTLIQLSRVDTGVDAEQVLTMQVTQLTRAESRDPATSAVGRQRFDEMRRELAALPGVIAVGIGSTLPLRTSGFANDVKVDGRPPVAGQPPVRAEQRSADASYFRAAGIPLLRGRMFTMGDETSNAGLRVLQQRDGVMGAGSSVAIINKAYADRVFPNEDPVGKQVAWTGQIVRELYPSMETELMTIIGVVGNTRDGARLDAEPIPALYSPVDHVPSGGGFVIRAGSNVSALAASATRIVRRIAPTALIEDVVTIQEYKDRSVSNQRLNAALISAFGALALVVAAVGIGGVLAFSVSARTNEIGIRMSLGADRGIIERMILREGGTLVVTGLLLGVTGAFFAGRVVRGMLFGISPNDPVTLVTAALAMAAIGIVACWIPALRAARVDPVITMRAQ